VRQAVGAHFVSGFGDPAQDLRASGRNGASGKEGRADLVALEQRQDLPDAAHRDVDLRRGRQGAPPFEREVELLDVEGQEKAPHPAPPGAVGRATQTVERMQ
jgi:hypothetical protein